MVCITWRRGWGINKWCALLGGVGVGGGGNKLIHPNASKLVNRPEFRIQVIINLLETEL